MKSKVNIYIRYWTSSPSYYAGFADLFSSVLTWLPHYDDNHFSLGFDRSIVLRTNKNDKPHNRGSNLCSYVKQSGLT